MIKTENLDALEEWASRNNESLTHHGKELHGKELRIALAIEHLAQVVGRGVEVLERIVELKK